jgi:dienelactone hydrolase
VGYEDWPDHARTASAFVSSDPQVSALGRVLGLRAPIDPPGVEYGAELVVGAVRIRMLSWSVGYGPTTRAYLLTPVGADRMLPGVLALHAHGGKRWIGAEQLVDLGPSASDQARAQRAGYGGLAPANELAARGYAVLAHDTFSWGSRRFDLGQPTPKLAALLAGFDALHREAGTAPSEAERFDMVSGLHEELLAKAAGALGQSFAGLVVQDDLVALDVLAGLPEVDSSRLGAFGLSGGGGRSQLLAALDPRVVSHIVTCMMATFESLMPDYLETHSWLLHSPGLWALTEWPDIAAIGAPRSTLVQYGRSDPLFPLAGMQDAHERIRALVPPDRYLGSFHDVGHEFGAGLQAEAWRFFDRTLAARS